MGLDGPPPADPRTRSPKKQKAGIRAPPPVRLEARVVVVADPLPGELLLWQCHLPDAPLDLPPGPVAILVPSGDGDDDAAAQVLLSGPAGNPTTTRVAPPLPLEAARACQHGWFTLYVLAGGPVPRLVLAASPRLLAPPAGVAARPALHCLEQWYAGVHAPTTGRVEAVEAALAQQLLRDAEAVSEAALAAPGPARVPGHVPGLRAVLAPHQQHAVQWMLDREHGAALEQDAAAMRPLLWLRLASAVDGAAFDLVRGFFSFGIRSSHVKLHAAPADRPCCTCLGSM
jgi:hypothetical protein